MLILTETWFSDYNTVDIEGFIAYHCFRTDRGGGGVSIYVRSSLNFDIVPLLNSTCDLCDMTESLVL